MDGMDTSAVYTFGDSILDCSTYTGGPTPGALLATNDDDLFPEFRGRDLSTALGREIPVVHRAEDGATVAALPLQIGAGPVPKGALTMLTIGGNDLLQGLSRGAFSLERLGEALRGALARLSGTQLFVGNVYDPSFGDDAHASLSDYLGVQPVIARRAYGAVNGILRAEVATAGGVLVDLHAHFLTGDPSWFTRVIEPSLIGASEVRRAFLAAWEESVGR